MPDVCAPPAEPGIVAQILSDTDCHAFGLVERGYAALSAPGGTIDALVTSLMIIAVAFFGYRLLLGRGLGLSQATTLTIKIGVVLTIAFSWATWQSVAYDTLARGPGDVASELITAIDAPAPIAGIQSALDRIEAGNVGWRTRAGIASPLVGGAPTAAMALNTSAFLLTLSTVGLLVVSRVILALLLAIAPLMAGFLLFDATRGLVEGWLRTMIAAALIPLGVLTLSAIELAMLEPLLQRMLAQQASGKFDIFSVTPIALLVIIFSIAMAVAARAMSQIARGVRLKAAERFSHATEAAFASSPAPVPATRPLLLPGPQSGANSPVARALESAARRDADLAASRPMATVLKSVRTDSAASVRAQTANDLYVAASPGSPRRSANVGRHTLPRASRAASRRDR